MKRPNFILFFLKNNSLTREFYVRNAKNILYFAKKTKKWLSQQQRSDSHLWEFWIRSIGAVGGANPEQLLRARRLR
jgi:hypothetical protein